MPNIWSGLTIDCIDPERVAQLWSALLRRPLGFSEPSWVYLGERGDPQPRLVFQAVAEPKAGKVRIHLDITVDEIEAASYEVDALGGSFTGGRYVYAEGTVVVMADPEGHEF